MLSKYLVNKTLNSIDINSIKAVKYKSHLNNMKTIIKQSLLFHRAKVFWNKIILYPNIFASLPV